MNAKKPQAKKPAKKPATAVKKKAAPHEPKKHAEPKVELKVALVAAKPIYAVGKRKTAVTQILLSGGNGTFTINNIPFVSYFQTADLQRTAVHPLSVVGLDKKVNLRGKIHGGGIHAQAESMRHALARALILLNPESRRTLKKHGFLTRDPRVKERKKPGLKRARRAPQFSKR